MTRQLNPHQENPSNNPDRIGAITASILHDAIQTKRNGEYSAQRRSLVLSKAAEQFTGKMASVFQSYSMKTGLEREPHAKQAWEDITGQRIIDVPFQLHETIPYFGASPDGVMQDDASVLVEIKCPEQHTHFAFLHDFIIPAKYETQMLAQIACMHHLGATSCQFISYHPDFDPPIASVLYAPDPQLVWNVENEVELITQEIIHAVVTARSNSK